MVPPRSPTADVSLPDTAIQNNPCGKSNLSRHAPPYESTHPLLAQ
ncbi:hypothetical protein BSTEL_1152 [Bifidobacterium stellenboschense]|uniref:Uncharacterized protein n=1 Tax=Bifidobacterium stellenboschense TaxID=762211 RepID=A0A087DKR9_9BIFI|nr:hypothetical protein BSTEL_1152 [Bifidobacterium stellenboschense]